MYCCSFPIVVPTRTFVVAGQMELFLKGQDAINDDLPGEDPEVVAEAIDGEAGPLNGKHKHSALSWC